MRLRLVLACALLNVGCGGGASLPDELHGTWGDTCCGGCARSYSFDASSVAFAQACPYTGSDSWKADVAEVFSGESIFRTSDSMYFGWHVAGTTLHLNKTNPGASKPSWTGEWWTSAHYTLTRK
jgi:hypothetical protein